MDDLKKFLEDLEKAPQPVAAEDPATDTDRAPPAGDTEPAGPPDPFAHLIGHGGPLVEASPFDAMLDQMADTDDAKHLEEEVAQRDPNYVDHDWQTIKKAEFEDEHAVWRCKRCFRQINVKGSETLAQACARVNLNPNCGEQVAAEVMET